MSLPPIRLGVNIDHVATIRNARGGEHPDPARAAAVAKKSGADGITIHLREDRRHIRDGDLERVRDASDLPINLEMAATEEMLGIALRFRPHACCLVPEKREERTTEGGLDVAAHHLTIAPFVRELKAAGIRVSLFIEADPVQVAVAEALGADIVEFHTGPYCHAAFDQNEKTQVSELEKIRRNARLAHERGIEVHAGHGLTFDTVADIARVGEMRELNIGHFIIGEAIFIGLDDAIARMRECIAEARAEIAR